MDTAREKAIRLLLELFELDDGLGVTPEDAASVVDAIIEAARAPESTHTRAVQEAT